MAKYINFNLIFSLLLFLFITQLMVKAEDQVWVKDIEAGLKKAKEEKKPIIVFVTAPWCSYCTIMHNSTLSSTITEQLLSNFVKIEVDFDSNPEFCGKWKINQLPVTMLLNQFGEFVARENGAIKQNDFTKWVGRFYNQLNSDVSTVKAQQNQINLLVNSFKNAQPENRPSFFSTLEKLYLQEKDKSSKEFILLKIQEAIQIQPPYLANLLNSSKLELRILSANIINNLKLEVEYDPWETFQVRAEQAKTLLLQMDKIKEKIKLPEK